jgi:diguanylate cyclase (GGDEF)-like protein/PAS domain S-box-containing protein
MVIAGTTSQRVEKLVYLPMLAALILVWIVLAVFTYVERGVVLERAGAQLGATVATLADFNELAATTTGEAALRSSESRTAAIWRALLQYPTARIWVDSRGVISAGERPSGDLAAFILMEDTRADFTVHAALPQVEALAAWRQSLWQRTAALVAVSIGFLLLSRLLTRALRQRRIAEEALRQHDALLNVVTQGAAKLLGTQHEDAIVQVLEMIGTTVLVGRVQLCRIATDEQMHLRSTVEQEWCAPGVPPTIDDPRLQSLDLTAGLPAPVAPTLLGGAVSFFASNAVRGSYAALFEDATMRSFLQIPIMVEEKLWGSLNFVASERAPRQWSWAESDTLQTLGGLVGVAIARARYVRELADANMIVQNSPTILYRLRGEPPFPLIYVSHNITKYGYDAASLVASVDWMSILVDPADQANTAAAMSRALQKDAQGASIEFRLRTADGGSRWVENRYTPVRDKKEGRLIEFEGMIIDITERKAAEEKIALLARTDALTGLANRATFGERLRQAFAASQRGAVPFAIQYLDLDHFKNVNDTLGHGVGDLLLCEVAARLKHCTRETDLVARQGGDEFAVLQADAPDPASAGALAQKIQQALAMPYLLQGNEIDYVTTSIGVCPYTTASTDPDAMLAQADLALYRSKDEGRNQFHFQSDELDQQVKERTTLTSELRTALDHEQLILFYQPQVEIVSGKIVGMEALLRWQHPQRGLLQAREFIPVAEKAGLMPMLGDWVLNQACRQMRTWRDAGIAPPVVVINLSLSQIKGTRELLRIVMESTARAGIKPSDLEFDVTEATLAQATLLQNDSLTQLRALGARIAIDDFGAEYSSFEYLRVYDVSHLKIASSFVRLATTDPESAAMIRAIMNTARELGIGVIAEGVETQGQRTLLAATGSTAGAQGNFFSAAVNVQRADQLLRDGPMKPMTEDQIAANADVLLLAGPA